MTPEPTDKDIQQSALFECLRPEIRKMAFQMEEKFRLHDKERGNPFRPLDFDFINNRLLDELDELYTSMGYATDLYVSVGYMVDERKPPSAIWKEAADCCNFILMTAVNYEREWRKGV